MFAVPVLFFIIIVNILIGSRSALYLLLSSTLLISYYAPNSYMFAFMQVTAGIVAIFSLSHLQRRSQLILSIFLIFITYTLVYMAFILTQEGEIRGTHLFALIWLAINCLLLTLTYPVIYIFEPVSYTHLIVMPGVIRSLEIILDIINKQNNPTSMVNLPRDEIIENIARRSGKIQAFRATHPNILGRKQRLGIHQYRE